MRAQSPVSAFAPDAREALDHELSARILRETASGHRRRSVELEEWLSVSCRTSAEPGDERAWSSGDANAR
jgi:hypothetical protein